MKIINKLPERWCILVTPENVNKIDKWRKDIKTTSGALTSIGEYVAGFKIYCVEQGWVGRSSLLDSTIISDLDFDVHVLKQLPEKWCVEFTEESKPKVNEWGDRPWFRPEGYVNSKKQWFNSKPSMPILPYSIFLELVYEPWKSSREKRSQSAAIGASYHEAANDITYKVVYDPAYPELGSNSTPVIVTSGFRKSDKATSMRDIKIPQDLLTDGDNALTAPQRDFILKHYNPFKQTMPQDRVIEFVTKLVGKGCGWYSVLVKEFPFVEEKKNWLDEIDRGGYFPTTFTGKKDEHSFYVNDAKLLGKKIDLMVEMHKFAQLRNEGWSPKYSSGVYHAGIMGTGTQFTVARTAHCDGFIFGIGFKTIEIAQEALQIFGERIKEVYNTQF